MTGTAIAVNGENRSGLTKSTTTAGKYKYVQTRTKDNTHRHQNSAEAKCPKRYHVLGGGVLDTGTFNTEHVNASFPIDGADADTTPDDGWFVRVDNLSTTTQGFEVFAVCAR
ncbi:MAG: hypothetical protein ACRDLL_05860 [Solirubrobacterales bacterium]